MKILLLVLWCSTGQGQHPTLSCQEQQRLKRLKEFLYAVQQQSIDRYYLQTYFLLQPTGTSASLSEDSLPQESVLTTELVLLQQALQGILLEEYDALPWTKFPRPEALPRLVGQAPPLEHLLGQPVSATDPAQQQATVKSQQANTLVIYRKAAPVIPLHYVLFDEHSNRIVSFLLIRQGDYHYFIGY